MRKIWFLALFMPVFSIAQSFELPLVLNDTLFTTSGYKIAEGEQVKLGVGSTPDGSFKFIRRNTASVFNYSNSTGRQDLANQANSMPRNSAGQKFKVVKVEARGNKKRGYVCYAVLGGLVRYEVDVENAIASGELAVPEEFKPKGKEAAVTIKQEISVADELKKLKTLLDEGVLTKEEYEAQKKKLLEKN